MNRPIHMKFLLSDSNSSFANLYSCFSELIFLIYKLFFQILNINAHMYKHLYIYVKREEQEIFSTNSFTRDESIF